MGQPFRFKKFEIQHERSTMKVGTDALLLGSWVQVDNNCKSILDIGTGSGVIALMLAQRSNAIIHAIDIDGSSVVEAGMNFENSPWNNRLLAINSSLQKYFPEGNLKYDLIVSNPPFFQKSLLPKSPRLQIAKHDVALSMEVFFDNVNRLLHPDGRWVVIVPVEVFERILKLAGKSGFVMVNKLNVIPKTGKPVSRVVAAFSWVSSAEPKIENLIVRDVDGNYSAAYKKLTRDYHAEGYI